MPSNRNQGGRAAVDDLRSELYADAEPLLPFALADVTCVGVRAPDASRCVGVRVADDVMTPPVPVRAREGGAAGARSIALEDRFIKNSDCRREVAPTCVARNLTYSDVTHKTKR